MIFNVFEGKKATDRWFPVLLQTNGVAVSGITYTQGTIYWATAGATVPNTYTLDTDNWREQGGGLYWVALGSDEWATQGGYSLQVKAAGAETFAAYVEVRDRLLADMDDDLIALVAGVNVNTIATGAIDAKAIAPGAIHATAISTAAATFLAGEWTGGILNTHQDAGSNGEALLTIRQFAAGNATANTQSGQVQYAQTDGVTVRFTKTVSQATGSPTIIVTIS